MSVLMSVTIKLCRPVVPGCAMAHPIFRRSVNPISTRGDRLCPPNYYWHTQIFRPSDGPANTGKTLKVHSLQAIKFEKPTSLDPVKIFDF